MTDDVGIKRSFTQTIISRLAAILLTLPYEPFIDAFTQVIHALPRMRLEPQVIDTIALLKDHKDWRVRRDTAHLCGNVAATNEEARQICSFLLKDNDNDVAAMAALGLARGGDYSPYVWAKLPDADDLFVYDDIKIYIDEFLKNAPTEAKQSILASFLLPGAEQSAIVLSSLINIDIRTLEVLRSELGSEDRERRWQAAQALVLADLAEGVDQEALKVAALEVLHSELGSEDQERRWQAARALMRVGQANGRALEVLSSELGSEDQERRWQAAQALVRTGITKAVDQEALEVLAQVIWQIVRQPSISAYNQAGRLLIQIANTNESITDRIYDSMNLLPEQREAIQRIHKKTKPQAQDGKLLAQLVSVQPEDSSETLFTRRWLFDWLWSSPQQDDQHDAQ